MHLSAGKSAFVEAVLGPHDDVLEVGCGAGQTSAAIRAGGVPIVTVDIAPSTRPDVVADARALPFRTPFGVVCSDTTLNQLGSTLPQALNEMARVGWSLVLREWLPADGRGSRDAFLHAMLTAWLRDGDDYALHDPHTVAGHLESLGWSCQISVHEEPTDAEPPALYPLTERRHADLVPTIRPGGPGIASSWVLIARPPAHR